jgi:hypothetical protein
MSAPDYFHMRVFWGAFDVSYTTPEYTGAAITSGGSSAAPGDGAGVRRAQLVFDRTPPGAFTDDVAVMHFDYMNITGGSPDDTWITSDFTDLEGFLSTWWTGVHPFVTSRVTLREIRWYRVGHGVVGSNPAERVTTVGVAGSSSSQELPPQCALSLTIKTARRKQWGRTYLPGLVSGSLATGGTYDPTSVDAIGTYTAAMAASCVTKQFYMGVMSLTAGSFFTNEQVQVDDIVDVIRRRRWRNPTHRYDST